MSDRDKSMRPEERFRVEVLEQFQFLADLPEMVGPTIDDHSVSYQSRRFTVRVLYDGFGRDTITVIIFPDGDSAYRAELSCLYVAARLGPAQHVKRSARTSREVAASITSQVKALPSVLQLLDGPGAEDLMKSCHARY